MIMRNVRTRTMSTSLRPASPAAGPRSSGVSLLDIDNMLPNADGTVPRGDDKVICLLPNCCFLSETSRMLEIYSALRARGVQASIATHGGPFERVLAAAGVPYDVIGPRMTDARAAAFVRSLPGIGPPDQSMWTDAELTAYALAEADYFRATGARAAVTGWTLTALLSTRLAGIPLATSHAGSYVPPVFERGLLPVPDRLPGLPGGRLMPRPVRRRLYNRHVPKLTLY